MSGQVPITAKSLRSMSAVKIPHDMLPLALFRFMVCSLSQTEHAFAGMTFEPTPDSIRAGRVHISRITGTHASAKLTL